MNLAGLAVRVLSAVKIGRLYLAHRNALVAHAGGGQASATLLDRVINNVSTVASAADSVKLPPFEQSKVVIVTNNGANALQVFSFEATGVAFTTGGGSVAGATGVSLATGKTAMYVGVAAGKWAQFLSA